MNNIFQYLVLIINGGALGYLIWTQNKIINHYKTIFDSTDIKRLAEFYKQTEELTKKHFTVKTKMLLDEALQDHYSRVGRQYDEMATFIEGIYLSLPKEEADDFIQRHLPSCKDLFPYNRGKENDKTHNILNQQDPSEQE